MAQTTPKHKQILDEYFKAFWSSLDYCRPFWEQYARLYEFYRNKRFQELLGTYSKVMLGLAHAAVADRVPKIHQNVFGTDDYLTLEANDPVAQLSAEAATMWVRHILSNDIEISKSMLSTTIPHTLMGGTAYRMVNVTNKKSANGEWTPRINSRPVEFFHVLPCPGGGGLVNPLDAHTTNAVPWVLWIDWMAEDKMKDMAEKGIYDKDEVTEMLKFTGQQVYLEDSYRDKFAVVGNINYVGPSGWRTRTNAIEDNSHRRRVVHWFRRDAHIIVAEDRWVIYNGPPVFEDGTIPLVKYGCIPDGDNWFNLSYLGLMEDLLKAWIMHTNYRLDYEFKTQFPTTWIRDDIAQHARNKGSDLRPKPNDVRFYPQSVQNIQNLVWYDRLPDVPAHAFMEEDRMKAILQKVAGQTETTASMGDVVGNKTATGVTSIMNELAARPNMESANFEFCFRDEIKLILAFGQKFIIEPQFVRTGKKDDGFGWATVTPDQISQSFSPRTHGTRYLADRDANFQKMLAFYPFWNSKPNVNPVELDRYAAKLSNIPDSVADKIFVDVPPPPTPEEMGEQGGVGGAASMQDVKQQIDSVAGATTLE